MDHRIRGGLSGNVAAAVKAAGKDAGAVGAGRNFAAHAMADGEGETVVAVPRFRQIAEDLIRRIDQGEFEEGTQLPTEAELMSGYGASRTTVRDAIKLLIGRGLVHSSPGRGTFVRKKVEPFALTLASVGDLAETGDSEIHRFEARLRGREAQAGDPRVEIQKAGPSVAWALGIEQAGYRDKITARVPDAYEASFFNLPDSGSTVIVHARIAYDGDGRPIRLTNTIYPADRNELYIEVGKVPAPSRAGD